jgi:hypothetical protein
VKNIIEELYTLDLDYQISRDEILDALVTLRVETAKKLYDAEIVRWTQRRDALNN